MDCSEIFLYLMLYAMLYFICYVVCYVIYYAWCCSEWLLSSLGMIDLHHPRFHPVKSHLVYFPHKY